MAAPWTPETASPSGAGWRWSSRIRCSPTRRRRPTWPSASASAASAARRRRSACGAGSSASAWRRWPSATAAVFQAPASEDVARFVGVETIVSGRVLARDGGVTRVEIGGRTLEVAAAGEPGACVRLAIRPEDVTLALPPAQGGASSARNVLPGVITRVTVTDAGVRVVVDCGFPLVATVTRRSLGELGLVEGMLPRPRPAPQGQEAAVQAPTRPPPPRAAPAGGEGGEKKGKWGAKARRGAPRRGRPPGPPPRTPGPGGPRPPGRGPPPPAPA